MNNTVKRIIEIVAENNGEVFPKSELEVSFEGSIAYPKDVYRFPVEGKLKSVSFSTFQTEDDLLSFNLEKDGHEINLDYDIKHNYTTMYYEYRDEDGSYNCMNDTIDKNIPIKVLRKILQVIEK